MDIKEKIITQTFSTLSHYGVTLKICHVLADQILTLFEDEGYVKLSPDSAILEGISNLKNLGGEE